MYQRPAHRPSAWFLLSVRFKRKDAKTQSLYLSTMSFVYKIASGKNSVLARAMAFPRLFWPLLHPFPNRPATFSAPKIGHQDAVRPSRLFQNKDFSGFLLPVFVRKKPRFRAIRPSRPCDGAAIAVQRGAYGIATSAPLQTNKALTAEQWPSRCPVAKSPSSVSH